MHATGDADSRAGSRTEPSPAPANPVHVVSTSASKAARLAALRALHKGLEETEANIRSLLDSNPALRSAKVRRLPLFTIRTPSFTIAEEPFHPEQLHSGTPAAGIPPEPWTPFSEPGLPPRETNGTSIDRHAWNDAVRDDDPASDLFRPTP
jgi:hypothetical protein